MIGFILVGVYFIFSGKDGSFAALIYGIPILIIGAFILLNKKEDKIEERKDLSYRFKKLLKGGKDKK